MSVIFFEGFNYNNTDFIKLDPKYWSFNNSVSYSTGRTNNAVALSNRPSQSGLELNSTLTLSNFQDPLSLASGIGIGFCLPAEITLAHRTSGISPYPHNENLLSFYDDSDIEVLKIDLIRISGVYGESLGLAIYQNSNLVDAYDFKSHVGYSWTLSPIGNNTIAIGNVPSFLEFYIDAKNSPKVSFKFSANNTYDAPLKNTSDQFDTPINGFNSLKSVKFYSRSTAISTNTWIDDLYISAGNSEEEALLGSNTKIYKVDYNNNYDPINWTSHNNYPWTQYDYVSTNDGDSTYIYSSNSGDISIFEMSDLSNTPNSVGGIKIRNIARSSSLASGWNMINVFSSGGPIISGQDLHQVYSTIYDTKDSFIFTNPITGSGWTLSDINNLKIGVKNLGPIPPLP